MSADVLVVDDEADIRELVAGILEDEGYAVRTAADSDQALAAIRARKPSLLVLDIWMQGGGMDGLELLDMVKGLDADLPVIMISGHGNIETAVSAIKRGAVDYLAKPGDFEEIQAILTGSDIERPLAEARPMSADRVRWEHIQRIYEQSGRNVSETARRLNMHRRTLQRILAKRAPR